MMQTSPVKFNENIQIMRAVAVLLVVFFHIGVPYFSVGYLGVDIFFVISGFLMPFIISKYDAWQFIYARIARIYPALLLCIVFCLAIGYLLMIPLEYGGMARSALAAAFSLSNMYFYFNAGYFDQDVETQPLLHSWSLGNEFMCYTIVFVMLLFTRDVRRLRRIALVVAAATLIVFLGWLWFAGGEMNYFNPIGRIFIFFVAFYANGSGLWQRVGVSSVILVAAASLAIMAFGWGLALEDNRYPNLALLLVPLFVVPILVLPRPLTMPRVLRGALVLIGDVSYSIYLWHWPIITFEKIFLRNFQLNWKEMLLLSAATAVVSLASYHLIEMKRALRCPTALGLGFAPAILVPLLALAMDGFSARIPAELAAYSSLEKMQAPEATACIRRHGGGEFKSRCDLPMRSDETVIFAGDSHSKHFLTIYEAGRVGARIFQYSAQAGDFVKALPALLKGAGEIGATKIYVTLRWAAKEPRLVNDIVRAVEQDGDDRFVFVEDVPGYAFDPVSCYLRQHSDLKFRDCGYPIAAGVEVSSVANNRSQNWRQIEASGLRRLETHSTMCPNGVCVLVMNNELIMRDANHLNERLTEKTKKALYGLIFGRS